MLEQFLPHEQSHRYLLCYWITQFILSERLSSSNSPTLSNIDYIYHTFPLKTRYIPLSLSQSLSLCTPTGNFPSSLQLPKTPPKLTPVPINCDERSKVGPRTSSGTIPAPAADRDTGEAIPFIDPCQMLCELRVSCSPWVSADFGIRERDECADSGG